MFYDGWYGFGMHAFWWPFWVILIAGVVWAMGRVWGTCRSTTRYRAASGAEK